MSDVVFVGVVFAGVLGKTFGVVEMIDIGDVLGINNDVAHVMREFEVRGNVCMAGYAGEMVSSAVLGFGAIFVWVVSRRPRQQKSTLK